MIRRCSFASRASSVGMWCGIVCLGFGIAAAGESQNKKSHPAVAETVSGVQLYKRYCAVCHGNDLKGNGPISPEFKNPPADLTTLTQRHEGKFPDAYVKTVLRNGVEKPAHGNTEMPIWGATFASIEGADAESVTLRRANLTNYINSMQAK